MKIVGHRFEGSAHSLLIMLARMLDCILQNIVEIVILASIRDLFLIIKFDLAHKQSRQALRSLIVGSAWSILAGRRGSRWRGRRTRFRHLRRGRLWSLRCRQWRRL